MTLLNWVDAGTDVTNGSDRNHMRTQGCSGQPFSDGLLTPQAIVAAQETAGGGTKNLFALRLGLPG